MQALTQDAAPLAGWTRRPLPDQIPMEGGLVRLVALDAELHGDDLWQAFGEADQAALWRYLPIGPFDDRGAFTKGIELVATRPDWVAFAILDRASGRALGTASYMRIDAANGVAEVGCVIFGEGLRRRAGASEAMLLMGRRIFDELGYRRYEWKCDAENRPSRRAAERLGFRFEGIFRQHMVVKGRNRDTAWFAMTDAEWPVIRARLAAFVDPANLDATGSQRQRLADMVAKAP